MAKIKKAQDGDKVKDSTKTYENSPFQQVKQLKADRLKNLKENEKQLEKQSVATPKKKMKNGGSLSGLTASTKRDKGTDPNGAFTKVQKKTLAGAKGKASLTKDKQLGATKMKSGGKMTKGKKC